MDLRIIGIDPGTTTAVAALDISGQVVAVRSKREYPLSMLLLDILDFGTPIVLGTDKRRVPGLVGNVAAKTGARVYAPNADLLHQQKTALLDKHQVRNFAHNQHEADALASALFAYEGYAALIAKIMRVVKEKGRPQDLRPLILEALAHEEVNLTELLRGLSPPTPKEKKPKRVPAAAQPPKKLLEQLQAENALLTAEMRAAHIRIAELVAQKQPRLIRNVPKDQQARIRSLESRIKSQQEVQRTMQSRLEAAAEFVGNLQGKIVFKVLDNLSETEWKNKRHLGIGKGDWVLVRDASLANPAVLKKLHDLNCRLAALRGGRSTQDIPLLDKVKSDLAFYESYASAPQESVLKALDHSKTLSAVVEDYKKKRQAELGQ